MSWYKSVSNFAKRTKLDKAVLNAGKAGLQTGFNPEAMGYAAAGTMMGSGMYTSGRGMYTSGRGSYNSVFDSSEDVVPVFAQGSADLGGIVLTHKEYIGDVYANDVGVNFSVQSYSLNPGLTSTFPWLSQIANNYEEYEIIQCAFTYKPTCSDNQETAGLGTVCAVTIYDVNDPDYTNKRDVLTGAGANAVVITGSLVHGVECDDEQNSGSSQKYVRNGPVVGTSLKDYDAAKVNFCVVGTAPSIANQTIGELWISYTVMLRKMKMFSAQGLGIRKDMFVFRRNGRTVGVEGTGDLTDVMGQFALHSDDDSGLTVGGSKPYCFRSLDSNIGVQVLPGKIDFGTSGIKYQACVLEFPANVQGTFMMTLRGELTTESSVGVTNPGVTDWTTFYKTASETLDQTVPYAGAQASIFGPTYFGAFKAFKGILAPTEGATGVLSDNGLTATDVWPTKWCALSRLSTSPTEAWPFVIQYCFSVDTPTLGVANRIVFGNGSVDANLSFVSYWEGIQIEIVQMNPKIGVTDFASSTRSVNYESF